MTEYLSKLRLKKVHLLFMTADLILIISACYLAFLLRFDGDIPARNIINLKAFILISALTAIPVFYLSGLYKISWSYVTITDLPVILRSVFLSMAVSGTIFYMFRLEPWLTAFPRSVIITYGMLLFLFVGSLRFLKRFYWQLIRGRAQPELESKPILSPEIFENNHKSVLVTGGAGYIGSVLVRRLLNAGYKVKVVDKLLFGEESIRDLKSNPNFNLIKEDILQPDKLKGFLIDVRAVIHLAAIVGEAACTADKDRAIQTNYLGTLYLARLCKAYGINRFIYTSTCSTYGQSEGKEPVREDSHLYPVDFYGETKIYAEKELMKLMDEKFTPTILRLSTVYGLSPRMRFDLVINTLTKKALKDGEIIIFGGNQWRPFVHVSDAARAILLALETPISKGGNQIFNVGDNRENYTISQIGQLVKECIPKIKIKTIDTTNDRRSYRVSFDKIEKVLNDVVLVS